MKIFKNIIMENKNKYNESVIYQITCNDPLITDTYIGSTTDLTLRIRKHKQSCYNEKQSNYNRKVYKFMRENGGFENFTFKILEEVNCENKNELLLTERYFIETLKSSLNVEIPSRTKEEYKQQNQELIKKINKKYREKNKDKIKQYYNDNRDKLREQQKQYRLDNIEKYKNRDKKNYEKNREKRLEKVSCDICSCIVNREYLIKHKRSLKCMKFQKLIENEN